MAMVAPVTEYTEDLVAQQRAAVVVFYLCTLRRKYTTNEIACLVGLTYSGALYLCDKLSGIPGLPIAKIDGYWQMLDGRWPEV